MTQKDKVPNSIQIFLEIDLQLVQAAKELQEQDRIQKLLKNLDRELHLSKTELAKAVNNLKWKTYDLKKIQSSSLPAMFFAMLGRKKEWAAGIQHEWETAVSRHQLCKDKIVLLEQQQNDLNNQLDILAAHIQNNADLNQRQIKLIVAQGREESFQLQIIADKLSEIEIPILQIKETISVAQTALEALCSFIEHLMKPLTSTALLAGTDSIIKTTIDLLAVSIIQEADVVELSGQARQVQTVLDQVQEHLKYFSIQFWPALNVTRPSGSESFDIRNYVKKWRYQVQKNQMRLQDKIAQLNNMESQYQQQIDMLKAERDQIVEVVWKPEFFVGNS